jgi:arginyl-tRNA synthetase
VILRLQSLSRGPIDTGEAADELWSLVLEAARLDEVVDSAIRSLELSLVAKYAFSLAQSFNAFYHRQPILKEDQEDARLWRAAAVIYVRRQLASALDTMGCVVPAMSVGCI